MRRQSGLLGSSGRAVPATAAASPTGAPVHRRHCIVTTGDATAATSATSPIHQPKTVAQAESGLVETTTTGTAVAVAAVAAPLLIAVATTVVGRNVVRRR